MGEGSVMRFLLPLTALSVMLSGSGCVVRTVTDESGEVIYQETEPHRLHESERKKQREVMERERELGW